MIQTAIFITATGTEVGKTVISSLLFGSFRERGLKTGYQKWVSTGGEIPEDLLYCLKNNNMPFDQTILDKQVVYRFLMPASPHFAAAMENREIKPEVIKSSFAQSMAENEFMVVEGVGGVLVPLRRDLLLADFLTELDIPILVVAASGLGTINHTLLTIEALRWRKLNVLGVVFSDEEEGMAADNPLIFDNMRTVEEMAGVEIFGRLQRRATYSLLQRDFEPIGSAIIRKLGY